MKRIMCVFMALALIIISGCDSGNEREVVADPILDEYLENIEEYEAPVHEAGNTASFVHTDDRLEVSILYPKTDIKEVDGAIEKWIEKTVNEYKKETADAESMSEKAELTVSYESYRVADRYVSIKMQGNFQSEYMAHPVDIVKTFSGDTEKNQLVDEWDVFKKSEKEGMISRICTSGGIEKEDTDEGVVNNFVLTDEGVEFVLTRGEYLPMSDGTVTLLYGYEDIAEYLTEDFREKVIPELKEEATEVVTEEVTEHQSEECSTEGGTEISYEGVRMNEIIDPEKPMLALTFDDGPSAHTERLLDIFEKYGGRGTFFVQGYLIDKRPDTLKRVAEEGHEIGNHSWSHRKMTNLTNEEITDQIMMARAKIYDVTGKDCLIVRPPYGAWNEDVKAVGKELGVSFINWSVDTRDWETRDADKVYEEIMNTAQDGAIILCHDLHETTVDAMENVIPQLIMDGYQLVTVSELIGYGENALEAGRIYYKQ